jgi:outer membrane scaffolding protein for murein synthesis (MipA/OmpV family)
MRFWMRSRVFSVNDRFALGLALAASLFAPVADAAEVALPDTAWIGAGLRSRPAYDGSASQRLELIPTVRYYGKPWFARTTQGLLEGGAQIELAPGLNLGAQLAYEGGRVKSESRFLRDHTVPDISPGVSAGLHVEWDRHLGPMPVTLLARGRQNLDRDRGAQADLRLTAIFFGSARATVAAFVQGTWAGAKSTQTYYGVDPAQSTGLAAFSPGSGPLFVAAGLLGGVDISRPWTLLWSVEARRLRGDAAESPLAERASSVYASASVAYRF